MFKQLFITTIVLFALGTASCTDSLNSSTEEFSELEFMEPMTSALASLERSEAIGNGIFIFHWDGLKPHFAEQDEDRLGMAMAIGFETETELIPPHNSPTVDMGTVTLLSSDGESIELKQQKSRFSEEHLIYSNRRFGPFQERSTLSFDAGGQYSIQTSGSGKFPSLDLLVTAPEKRVSILSPSVTRLQSHSGDLELSWDAVTDKPVAIMIKPSMRPGNGKKPGPFKRGDSEMILLEDHNGSTTLSGDLISEIAAKSDENAVHISVGQLHINDLEVDGKTYRVIMRMGDHLLVDFGS